MKYLCSLTAALWLVVDTLQAGIKIGDNIESISLYALVVLKNGNIGIGDSTQTEGTLVVSGTIVASQSIIA